MHRVRWGTNLLEGDGVNGHHTLFKMLIMMHCIFIPVGSFKINIFEVLFWEGGKEGVRTLCTLLIMLIILKGNQVHCTEHCWRSWLPKPGYDFTLYLDRRTDLPFPQHCHRRGRTSSRPRSSSMRWFRCPSGSWSCSHRQT